MVVEQQEIQARPCYAFQRQMQASSSFNCTDQLHALHIPTLIMHGKKDKTVPYYLAEEMHSDIEDSKMLTFEGGHIFFLMRERQRFLEAIADFVASRHNAF